MTCSLWRKRRKKRASSLILQLDILTLVVTTAIGFVTTGTLGYLVHFVKEQRKVNAANELANRSMQRDVLYRYFAKVVERGEHITPEEYKHVANCYEAYHSNGGNGAGSLMWERIQANVTIDTGRE